MLYDFESRMHTLPEAEILSERKICGDAVWENMESLSACPLL